MKLVDTLASGASGGNPVEVQVLSWAPFLVFNFLGHQYYRGCPSPQAWSKQVRPALRRSSPLLGTMISLLFVLKELLKGIKYYNRFFAIGARRNYIDRHAYHFFYLFNVGLGIFWQVIILLYTYCAL